MKKHHLILYTWLIAIIVSLSGCSKTLLDNSQYGNLLPEIKEPVPPVSHVTLKDKEGWLIDTMDNGLIHYQLSKYIQTQTANQFVNVVEVDLTNPEYELEFVSLSAQDTLSAVAASHDAIAGINGTYEMDASFIKTNGNVVSPITLTEGHLRFWKHEGAISYNAGQDLTIGYGTKEGYAASPYLNIFSAAPILIDNYAKVGEDFIGDVTGINLNSLDYEDYRRHQGVRHPRTAVALTEDKKLLLVTIDGRFPESDGMTAKEVTQFLANYFGPQDALNMDGGGSTTMFIKDKGYKGVVNYPTDNEKRDHYGQRMLRTFILVKKKSNDSQFAGGDGTEANPYLIATATHLQNMHTLNWSSSESNPYYFKLVSDIDMIGRSWAPLNNVDPYAKYLHFDGDGHVIRNLKVPAAGYGSLFGVLLGSCKNLGLVNVDVESTNGGGAIAGYLGLNNPGATMKVGQLENCFSTGKVSGKDAVGGLVGNVGKPNTAGTVSRISNCFSTAEVIATNSGSSNSRTGGVAGIIYSGGIVENCFAAGKVLSNTGTGKGAGGVVGWTDSKVKGLVSFSKDIRNVGTGTAGRITSAMGQVSGIIAQGENCWASEDVVVYKDGAAVPSSSYVTGTVTVAQTAYDGETKTKAFLSDMNNYHTVLEWELGPYNPWASTTNSKGYPILQWLFLRGDYENYY